MRPASRPDEVDRHLRRLETRPGRDHLRERLDVGIGRVEDRDPLDRPRRQELHAPLAASLTPSSASIPSPMDADVESTIWMSRSGIEALATWAAFRVPDSVSA